MRPMALRCSEPRGDSWPHRLQEPIERTACVSSSLELLTVPMGKQKRLSPAVMVPSWDTAGEQKPDFPRAPRVRSILMASGTEL